MIVLPIGINRPGHLGFTCAAVPGPTPITTPAAPTATTTTPTTATTTWAFEWCCVLPRFFRLFFWPGSAHAVHGGALRPHRPAGCSGNACAGARALAQAEAKDEEQRQAGLARSQALRHSGTRGAAGDGRISKPGLARQRIAVLPAMPCPAPLRVQASSPFAATRVCRSHPPSSRPTPATMRLACS